MSSDRRELLEFVESITNGYGRSQSDEQLYREFVAAVLPRRVRVARNVPDPIIECDLQFAKHADRSLFEGEWNPAKHPRTGSPPNAGWFAPTVGEGTKPPRSSIHLAQNPAPSTAPTHVSPTAFDADAVKRSGIIVKKDPGQPKLRFGVPGPNDLPQHPVPAGAQWNVPWDKTVDPSPLLGDNKGWIVQHVTMEVDARDAALQPVPPMKPDDRGNPDARCGGRTKNVGDDYLEAWRVHPGGKVTNGEEASPGIDEFRLDREYPGTFGRAVIRGKAVFIPESRGFPNENSPKWNWPSRGETNHKQGPTGVLPSTRDEAKNTNLTPNMQARQLITG